jgi:hypothetical protein
MKETVVIIEDETGALITVVAIGKVEIQRSSSIDGDSNFTFMAKEWITTGINGKIINDIIKNESTE